MFNSPPQTLKKALHSLLENPKEYLADVCFEYPQETLWAHRALLLARIPQGFREKYLPFLENKECVSFNVGSHIPYLTFQALLRFWYTADFCTERQQRISLKAPSSLGSTVSPVSDGSTETSNSSGTTYHKCSDELHRTTDMREQLETLEQQLNVQLFPRPSDKSKSDFEQLVCDLECMANQQLGMDVTVIVSCASHPGIEQRQSVYSNKSVRISSASDDNIPSILYTNVDSDEDDATLSSSPSRFAAHKFILASQSSYFYAMFCAEFREASRSTVHLPSDIFTSTAAQVIIHYFYTNKLVVPPAPSKPSSPAQQRLSTKKHTLRVLQHVFSAADYLGHFDSICAAVLYEMENICHKFKCLCSDCAILLPAMLWFAEKNASTVPSLRPALMALYSDPVHSIAPLWSQRPFATLVAFMAPSPSALAERSMTTFFKGNSNDPPAREHTLVSELSSQTVTNITKHNAIHVLHSLHLCLSQLRGANPFPTWSTPVLDLLNPIVNYTVDMVSSNFDFYCVEYPILLSCVDGIGSGFSVDFLEFLLRHVLDKGIHDANAAILYQGIVRDLVGRQEVVKNLAVDGVLIDARQKCANYLARRWVQVKSQGGFKNIDKEVMRQLEKDIDVPYRCLTKSVESDFAAIFGFRPRAFKSKISDEGKSSKTGHSRWSSTSSRRLSLSSLRPQRSIGALRSQQHDSANAPGKATDDYARMTRSRSLSNDRMPPRPVISDSLRAENINKISREGLSSQPLIHLLSLESEARRQRLENDQYAASVDATVRRRNNDGRNNNPRPLSLADELLPLDVPSRIINSSPAESSPRPSRLRFELPVTPLRAKSPLQKPFLAPTQAAAMAGSSGNDHGQNGGRRGRSPRRSLWGLGSSSSDISDEEELITMVTPVVGAKVELLRRPLPTLGTIKYIGPVNFAKGTYVGIELQNRLGTNDGAVDGVRYFQTDPQRGVFVKVDDFKVLSLPNNPETTVQYSTLTV